MGEGKNGVVEASTPPPVRLEREVENIRDHLDGIVTELDRRRHELTDWRLQARRHRGALVAAGGTLLAIVVGFVALGAWSKHRHERMLARTRGKARSLRRALARILDDPDKVAKPTPSIGHKIAAAAGSTIAVAVSKKLVERLIMAPRAQPRTV